MFTVNGRTYDPPARPIVVICVDGCGDEYLSTSIAHGKMPHVARLARDGYRGFVRGALPSFTNVNNAAICTGLPPSGTGIPGNYFLDPETGEEVMMNSSKFLRADTIFPHAQRAGRKVAVVTAKEKLRDIFASGSSFGSRMYRASSSFRWAAITFGRSATSWAIVSSNVCIGFFAPSGSREKSNPFICPFSGCCFSASDE